MKKKNLNKSIEASRSWFCVLNNPQNIFGDISPDEMVNKAIEMWCKDKPARSCGVNYEIGDSGTPHMHMVLEDPAKTRFTAVQKIFTGIHIEPTRGNKEQALDYINKRGRFEEKNHTIVVPAVIHGEIKACKGSRKDLDIIQELLEQGKTPNEIMDISIHFRKHETLIRKQYYRSRFINTPKHREIKVIWHVGEAGSGKSYSYVGLCKEYGQDNVYLMNDYENGGLDNYCGEPVLFMDEFKGNLRFGTLLNYLDVYPVQFHSRYANGYALWTEVHITSIYPPEEVYKNMVEFTERNRDKYEQLLRRLDTIIYHYKENDEYKAYEIPSSEYKDYESLRDRAMPQDFMSCSADPDNPFVAEKRSDG